MARDQELNREVALKEIQSQFADHPDSRSRFLLEAEVTGGLEHPGIVPVYGLGQYEDGRPYYAMRFIKGTSLKDSIKAFHDNKSLTESERALELRKLLGRFVDVCQAVSFAHSRGVLHRDLKPANVMLGDFGETLVVDWGLAKIAATDDSRVGEEPQLAPAQNGSARTLAGDAVGTPGYMPPEQAAGKLDEMGPTSDVYSLGATLYHLLTGTAAFRVAGSGNKEDITAVLKRVKAGNFIAPRSVNPALSPALEAVCLKAMSVRPKGRYSSPLAVADDIENYLADEPVSARQEPLTHRARRWLRKHPTLMTTTAAVVLLSVIGLSVFSSKMSAANQRETEAKELALSRAKDAKEQSHLALELLTVINDLQANLEPIAGSDKVRRALLEASLGKLTEVSTKYLSRTAVDRQTVRALIGMGNTMLTFGAKREETSERTGTAESAINLARTFFSRARDISESIARSAPDNIAAQEDLALAHTKLSEVWSQSGDLKAAFAACNRSLEINESLLAYDAENLNAKKALSSCYNNIGDLHYKNGNRVAALKAYTEAIGLFEPLFEADSANWELCLGLSTGYANVGDIQIETGTQAATEAYEKSIATIRRLPADATRGLDLERLLAHCHNRIGDVRLQSGDAGNAILAYKLGVEAAMAVNESDPRNTRGMIVLAVCVGKLGTAQLGEGQQKDAIESLRESKGLFETLATADRANLRAQANFASSCAKLAEALDVAGDSEAARLEYQLSIRTLAGVVATDTAYTFAERNLAISYRQLGNLERRANEPEAAIRSYDASITTLQQLVAKNPADVGLRADCAGSRLMLGDVHLLSGSPEKAIELYEGCVADYEVLRKDKQNATAQRDAAVARIKLGGAFMMSADFESAAKTYGFGAEIVEGMIQRKQNVNESVALLAQFQALALQAQSSAIAIGPLEAILKQEADHVPVLLEIRLTFFRNRGNFIRATEAATKLRQLGNANEIQLYNAACVFAVAAKSVEGNAATEQHNSWMTEAISTLKQSIDAGWSDFGHIRGDEDLSALRQVPAFEQMLKTKTDQ